MANAPIYQFKITLNGIRPPIWRRFQVKSDITFHQFHSILQKVMGWYNVHLYHFDLGFTGITDAEFAAEFDDGIAQKTKLNRYIREEKDKFRYEYDFGDGWDHTVILEKILPPEKGVRYPRCIKGKRACPPEDCGGVWGYAELLEILADPNNPEHDEYLEWLGGDFDPEAFDLDKINRRLQA
jgi:hypothetical protein